MMLRIDEVKIKMGETEKQLPGKVLELLHLHAQIWNVLDLRILRKSVDARDKLKICYIYSVAVSLARSDGKPVKYAQVLASAHARGIKISGIPCMTSTKGCHKNEAGDASEETQPLSRNLLPPVIVGFGPCGIFAALVLARAGLCPIVLERGKPVDAREKAVDAFWNGGSLDENNNVLFGEGGAGTFSDGKLTTGIKDPRKRYVLEAFANAGGGEDLLYLANPHLGTDILQTVVKNLRQEIIALGGTILFGRKFAGFSVDESGEIADVYHCESQTGKQEPESDPCEHRKEIQTNTLILAIGHSARDTYQVIYRQGISMTQKPFSMGVRIEHTQRMINESQYGADFEKHYGMTIEESGLPPATYKLSGKTPDGRGVYTFCMCPGGFVIPASSEKSGVCTNGMSNRARDGYFANSAILVDVRPEDFGSDDIFAGMELQRQIERKAFELAGSSYTLLRGTIETLGAKDDAITNCLPSFIIEGIRTTLPLFGRKIKGFDAPKTTLYGPETRSSAPVRILRDANMQTNIKGIFPCGEGAGYAGGIMSAAVDGIRVAEQIIQNRKTNQDMRQNQ
jgi:uncharacterized FAD-dependent dehydrogenase